MWMRLSFLDLCLSQSMDTGTVIHTSAFSELICAWSSNMTKPDWLSFGSSQPAVFGCIDIYYVTGAVDTFVEFADIL
jgi:hypothetical protein